MNPDAWAFIQAALTVAGAVVVGVFSSWLLRRSQKESAQINLLTNLVDQVQEERDNAKAEAKQVPLWRRYAGRLRQQIYGLGGVPVEADKELEL